MKKRLFLSLLLIVVGVPLLGYVAATIAGAFARDLSAVDASAVALPPVATINVSANAYTELQQAVEAFSYPDADTTLANPAVKQALDGTGWDAETLQDILDNNADALALFTSASTKEYQDPSFVDPARVDLNAMLAINFSAYRRLAEVQGVAALDQLDRKQTDAAAATALTMVKLGRSMESSYGSLVHYLVAQRVKELGVDVLARITAAEQLSPGMRQEALDVLSTSYDRGAYVTQALKFENALLRNTEPSHADKIMMGEVTFGPVFARLLAENNFYFQPLRTEQLSIDWYATLIRSIGSSCTTQVPAWKDLAPRSVLARLWTQNAIGKSSLDTGAISFDGLQKRWCSLDAKIEARASDLRT